MATIDRIKLLCDEKLWLPDANVLSDAQMSAINETVITTQIPADDEQYYAEALCKGLRSLAFANKSKFKVDSEGIRKEKVGGVEIENFEGLGQDPWGGYIRSLSDICPLFGYTGLDQGIGMTISPGEPFVINDCPDICDSVLRNDTGDDDCLIL